MSAISQACGSENGPEALDACDQSPAPGRTSVAGPAGRDTSACQSDALDETSFPATYGTSSIHTILYPTVRSGSGGATPWASPNLGHHLSTYDRSRGLGMSPSTKKLEGCSSLEHYRLALPKPRQPQRVLRPKLFNPHITGQGFRSPASVELGTSISRDASPFATAGRGDTIIGHLPALPPINKASVTSQLHALPLLYHEHSNDADQENSSMSTTSCSVNGSTFSGTLFASPELTNCGNPSPIGWTLSDSTLRETPQLRQLPRYESQIPDLDRGYASRLAGHQVGIFSDQEPTCIPIVVDFEHASKSADEKRKRNAGASARFRQRRKQKELAAAAHIKDTDCRVLALTKERDFYRSERNVFRDRLAQIPGALVPARPPSPQISLTGTTAMASVPALPPLSEHCPRKAIEPWSGQQQQTDNLRPSFARCPEMTTKDLDLLRPVLPPILKQSRDHRLSPPSSNNSNAALAPFARSPHFYAAGTISGGSIASGSIMTR